MRTDCSPNLDIKLRPPVQEASKAGNIFITFEIQRMTVGVYWDVITDSSPQKGFKRRQEIINSSFTTSMMRTLFQCYEGSIFSAGILIIVKFYRTDSGSLKMQVVMKYYMRPEINSNE